MPNLKPTSPEARALAELLDVLEPAFALAPHPEAPAPKAPRPQAQPARQGALDL